MFLNDLTEEPLQGITLVYGPAASGKTTLCLQALRGRSVYVTSARNFSPERLQTMRSDANAVIAKLVVYEPQDLDSLEKAIGQAVSISRVVDLIVVDSLGTLVRQVERKLGNLALSRILQQLSLAVCPVILTSDVYDRVGGTPETVFVGGDMLRLAARTIVELKEGTATIKKHPTQNGRAWNYRITDAGLEKI